MSKTKIFDQKQIKIQFNKFFTNVGPKSATEILKPSNKFENYFPGNYVSMSNKPDSINKSNILFLSETE